MNTPLFLMGAALLFWGVQVDLLFPALIMALALEGSRWLKIRWELSDKDYGRIMDLCAYLSFFVLAYALITKMNSTEVMGLFGWIPMIVFPIMLAQAYGEKSSIPVTAFSLKTRKKINAKQQESQQPAKNRINISYIFLASCLLSSGIGNNRSPWFFVILFSLAAWALWVGRNPGHPAWLSLILLFCIGGTGYIAQVGLQNLQETLEAKMMELIFPDGKGRDDPFQSRTAIGSIGELKLSEKIIYRIQKKENSKAPKYLRSSSYNVYSSAYGKSTWYSSPRIFDSIQADSNKTRWQLFPPAKNTPKNRIIINTRINSGKGILPIPFGTTSLANLPVETVELSKLGALHLTGASKMLHTEIQSSPALIQDTIFTEKDLLVPDTFRPMLKTIMQDSRLLKDSPEESARMISNFLGKQFTYSLVQKSRGKQGNSLEHFLTSTYSGHCELFATATVLLARMAGIPARYATGWLIDEFSELEQCYIVRSRHAHAWSMLYINGQWQLLDTTPPDWLSQETAASSFLTPIRDFFSWCWYQFSVWRDQERQTIPPSIYWISTLVLLTVGYRFIHKRTKRSSRKTENDSENRGAQRGTDSDFFRIEHYFSEIGYERYPNETHHTWLHRLEHRNQQDQQISSLRTILKLYHCYRFNPQCEQDSCKQKLNALVKTWLSDCKSN